MKSIATYRVYLQMNSSQSLCDFFLTFRSELFKYIR